MSAAVKGVFESKYDNENFNKIITYFICKMTSLHVCSLSIGRVEKTDPRYADYPLTPAPRTTLWTTPRTTLRTTPTDYPKWSTNFLLRRREIQEAYLLFLHDHNCTKNSRHFLFRHFSTQSFSFSPHSSPATFQRCFHNGRSVSAVEMNSFCKHCFLF